MKFGNFLRATATAGAMLLAGSNAVSAPLYFFGNAPAAAGVFPSPDPGPNFAPIAARNAFENAILAAATESFESSPTGALFNTDNQLTVLGGATLSQVQPEGTPFTGAEVFSGTPSNGRFNTTGGATTGRWLQTDSAFTIDLGNRTAGAFGFYGTDFGDFDGGLSIALLNAAGELIDDNIFTDENNTPLDPTPGQATDGALLFFGYASDVQFRTIIFTVRQGTGVSGFPLQDLLGFDDLVIGNLRQVGPTPAPEPGSLALVGAGLLAAWALGRRHSN